MGGGYFSNKLAKIKMVVVMPYITKKKLMFWDLVLTALKIS